MANQPNQTAFTIFSFFILCIVLPLVLWILYHIVAAPAISEKDKITSLVLNKKLTDRFRSGDLLFFSGNYVLERGIRTLQGGPFSHACVIIIDEKGTPYIIEVDNHPKKELIGAHIMTFHKKIELSKKKRGVTYFEWHSLYAPNEKRPRYAESKEWIEKYKHQPRDLQFFSWLSSDFPKLLPYTRKKNAIFCSELIIKFLNELGLIELLHHPAWYSPQNLRDGSGVVCVPNVYWKNNGLIGI